jgi:hypothetical protein
MFFFGINPPNHLVHCQWIRTDCIMQVFGLDNGLANRKTSFFQFADSGRSIKDTSSEAARQVQHLIYSIASSLAGGPQFKSFAAEIHCEELNVFS